jgi:hypothetical protein
MSLTAPLHLLQGLPPTTQVQVPTPEEASTRRGVLYFLTLHHLRRTVLLLNMTHTL